ncbi:hypothetical protein DBV23_15845 [Edwardsiella ictaluri]|uniref:Uncharacterized protein n=1 Tax=Edwardsiella ictaluri (strain 93-146) TaxID=634503 RepID=C5BH16_EDWI9|nr:hypothetical protein [Edwardsiella ictaluri]ACR69447.1 hypothetical protein NT01EI_2273 [Edwardsiella ictaluri 93-146]AVZ83538.1 hypothetical protein DBV23_15845 [Edwardsiella ictaluri]EKS7764170.1 hypothetical protein [Edwardsiella ictaluri]EKS7771029.1 hypothetical protein [Edwardsiella ictaluri]EKS7774121.1 hypothetical protein [Edwardsiella ictaluri]
MPWQRVHLTLPDELPPITCSVLAVHPWTHGAGLRTDSGCYLSPENAIAFLADRIGAISDTQDFLLFLVCAGAADDFARRLTELAGVLPLPEIARLRRLVDAGQILAESRMQIPARPRPGIPAPTRLSLSNLRQLHAAGQATTAMMPMAGSLTELSQVLQRFHRQRNEHLNTLREHTQRLQQTSCELWQFSPAQNTRDVRQPLQWNIPQPEASFSLGLLFVGDDLSTLRACIYEPDNRPRP